MAVASKDIIEANMRQLCQRMGIPQQDEVAIKLGKASGKTLEGNSAMRTMMDELAFFDKELEQHDNNI